MANVQCISPHVLDVHSLRRPAEATMETAFEEVTEEQRSDPRMQGRNALLPEKDLSSCRVFEVLWRATLNLAYRLWILKTLANRMCTLKFSHWYTFWFCRSKVRSSDVALNASGPEGYFVLDVTFIKIASGCNDRLPQTKQKLLVLWPCVTWQGKL